MATIKPDLVQGNTGGHSLSGMTFERVFYISDLVQTGHAMIIEAKTALAAGGVDIGDQHPTVCQANGYTNPALVASISYEQTSHNQIRATATYKQFESNYRYSITSAMGGKETTKYYTVPDGSTEETMYTAYEFPADYPDENYRGLKYQGGRCNRVLPHVVLRISRTELYTLACDSYGAGHLLYDVGGGGVMVSRNLAYAGKTNRASWNIRPTDAAERWLCNVISASSEDNGLSWQVDYEFEYSPSSWQYQGTFVDPFSKLPPKDIVDGIGRKNFRQNIVANFSLLQLI